MGVFNLFKQGVLGLYRGYFTTLAREIPFSLIQFPLWEFLKKQLATVTGQVLTDDHGCFPSKIESVGGSKALASLFVWCCCWWVFCCSDHTPGCGQDQDNAGQGWQLYCSYPRKSSRSHETTFPQAGTSEASLGTLGMMKWVYIALNRKVMLSNISSDL